MIFERDPKLPEKQLEENAPGKENSMQTIGEPVGTIGGPVGTIGLSDILYSEANDSGGC